MMTIPSKSMLNTLPHPVFSLNVHGFIVDANAATESFFELSLPILRKTKISDLCAVHSPILELINQARAQHMAFNEHSLMLELPRLGEEKLVDFFASPLLETPIVSNVDDKIIVVMLKERTLAEKIGRQLTHRGAARSVSALAAMLAHEIKNPLSGIRGAAQLLETSVNDDDRVLTELIREETDRIVRLVERFEAFSDSRPITRGPVNIHSVLEHVKRVSISGFAQDITFHEYYDPSLPPVDGNSDLLIQVFLNLIKNAAEAMQTGISGSRREITLTTAYKPSMRMSVQGSTGRVELPLEVCVRDTGSGIAPDLLPVLFDPFVTTKESGSGLGLAMVAKIIGDHGGIVECEPARFETVFRILLPVYRAS
jgi:two-component system, NtrC family, nitrogen regulation sensor histidine kinase GlnL